VRILLRAGPGQDLYGEFSTLAEAFLDAGGKAQLRPRTRHPARAWELARRTGSSRPDRLGAFAEPGLLVRDAEAGRRWLPRERLSDYLRALQAEDRERLLLLTQPPEAA
jgi:hypothetical protein